MSGTLPKSAGERDRADATPTEIKMSAEKNSEEEVPTLLLDEEEGSSTQRSKNDAENEEEFEEEEPLPQGWSKETNKNGDAYYWFIKDGRVSFKRPREDKDESQSMPSTTRKLESASTARTQTETPYGAAADRKNNHPVVEFEKLLRDQMFHRQLMEIMKLGDKELLRALIVRYESSKTPDERNANDDDDNDNSDSNHSIDASSETEKQFNDAKQLLKEVDYYQKKIRELVFRGHWIEFSSTGGGGTGGVGGGGSGGVGFGGSGGGDRGGGGRGGIKRGKHDRMRSLMLKYDRLNGQNSNHLPQQQQQRQSVKQMGQWEEDDEEWAIQLERQHPRPEHISREIEDLVDMIKGQRTKESSQRAQKHRSQRGVAPESPSEGSFSMRSQATFEGTHEDQEQRVNKRVKHFLRQQLDYAESLAQHLRPRESRLPILAMDKRTMGEIRSYASPKPIVHRVMQAVLLLLGYDEATTSIWANCKAACVPDGRNGLNRRLMKFDATTVAPFILKRSWNMLRKLNLEDVQKASPGAATFYVWASSVLKVHSFYLDDEDEDEECAEESRVGTSEGKRQQIIRQEQKILGGGYPEKQLDDYRDPQRYASTGYHSNSMATGSHGNIYRPH